MRLLLCLFLGLARASAQSTVDYYEDLIEARFNASRQYTYDVNAFAYKPKNEQNIEFGTFDFIIVGAGATGPVVANRLTEEKWTVLLLEAGNFTDPTVDIPNMMSINQFTEINWGYLTTKQTKCCLDMVDQKCAVTRGRAVGGTTAFNGLMYYRGSKENYDDWNALNPGWSYDDVLPYFKKAEGMNLNRTYGVVDQPYHGFKGPLGVETRNPQHPLTSVWVQANAEKGHPARDLNAESMLGCSISPIMTRDGVREHTGNAYIKPVLGKRRNLNVTTGSYVTRVILDKYKRARGVRFARHNQYYIARARKEVIISAGPIGSPQILLNSGIGPKAHLAQVGVSARVELPVGSTLREHLAYCGLYLTTNFTQPPESLRDYIRQYLNGTGSLTAPDEDNGSGFYRTRLAPSSDPDVELIFFPNDGFAQTVGASLAASKQKTFQSLNGTGLNIIVANQKSLSVGTVRLKNNDPFEHPIIDPQYFTDPQNLDMERLYEGIQIALNLSLSTAAFQAVNATLVRQNIPECDQLGYMSQEYWMCAIKYFTCTLNHAAGTCPMGPNSSTAVIDTDCKVYGVRRLRVADSSIYPFVLLGHPQSQCVMIGEKVSDVIKRAHGAA